MSKKLKNEDLEQDLLIEYSSRFMYFYNQNKAAVLGGGIGIILAIGLTIGYFVYSAQQESEAQDLLAVAEQSFTMGDFETALYGDDEDFTLGFNQIARNYSRTSAGNLAKYYAAVSEYELGNFEGALEYIEKFSPPRGIMGVAPIAFHATLLTELDRYEEAGRMYEKAADWDKNQSTTPKNLYEAALAYKEAGNNRKTIELLDTILEEYPDSRIANKANRLKGRLAPQS